MSGKQISSKSGSDPSSKTDQAEIIVSQAHDMIAKVFGDYIVTLYDIDNFSTIPGYSENFYALKIEAADEETATIMKKALGDIRKMGLEVPITIDEDVGIIGVEDIADYIPLLKGFDSAVMQNVFDSKKSAKQPLPYEETLIRAVRKGEDPFVFHLISDDRCFFSDSALAQNMIENFKTVAGMHDTYIPPTYSIALIERAIATANSPTSKSGNNFWLN